MTSPGSTVSIYNANTLSIGSSINSTLTISNMSRRNLDTRMYKRTQPWHAVDVALEMCGVSSLVFLHKLHTS